MHQQKRGKLLSDVGEAAEVLCRVVMRGGIEKEAFRQRDKGDERGDKGSYKRKEKTLGEGGGQGRT